MKSVLSPLWVVLLGVVFVSGALPARGDSPERVVREFLALTYDGRFAELPKTPAACTERFERQVRNILRVRCIRADQIAISDIDEKGEQATLHADVAMAKRDPRGSGDWSPVEIVPLRFELLRQGDTWLVAEVANLDEEHAERVLRAIGDERERRLREQPERLTRGLARALYALSLAHLNTGAFKHAADASAVALRVAREVGDRGGEALALGAATYPAKQEEIDRLSQESLAIAQTAGDPDVLARAWYDRGRTIVRLGHLDGAVRTSMTLESYANARRLAARAEDPIILIRVLYSLANMAAHQADYLSARRYIDEGASLAREVGDEIGEMAHETVLSTVYIQHGDLERGVFHHARATDMAEKTQALSYPTLLVRWGCLLVNQGRYDEARAMFDRVLVRTETGLTTRMKSMPGNVLGSALRAMAVIEADSGNFSEAECLNQESARHHGSSPGRYRYELAPYYASRGTMPER